MRSDVLRVYKSLHTWTGLISGMALFICFYAGALTMFKEPLSRWATPPGEQAVWVEPGQLPSLIAATVAAYPAAAAEFTLNLQPRENSVAPLVWAAGDERLRTAPLAWTTLDTDGALVSGTFQPAPMAELIDLLHQTAGIPGGGHHYLGVYLMGAVCVLYALALMSGLILLLPTLVKDLFALRPGSNRKRFWLDAHNVVGLASLPFHIVMALSVIVFAFHDEIYDGLAQVVYGDRPLWERPHIDPTPRALDHLLPPAALLDRVAAVAPEFIPREMHYWDVGTAAAEVRITGETPWQPLRDGSRGLVTVDPYSGEITDTVYLPGHENGWTAIINAFFALHFGNFGGALVRWSYLLLGFGGAFLFYSGNLLWVESRRRRQRRLGTPVVQSRATAAMAAATVGVCWGAVAGISAAAVAGRWLARAGLDLQMVHMTTYYAVFLGAIGWAFARGAAVAAVELLWLCAVATLAIPATGLLALLGAGLPIWLHPAPDLLLVEATALVMGLAFAHAARRTARRIAANGSDTVWSVASPRAPARPVAEATEAGS